MILSKFSQMLPKELMDKFGKIMLSSEENEKELDLVAKELTILGIKDNLKLLTLKMREFEKKGDKDGLLTVQNQYTKFAKSLASINTAGDGGIIFDEE